MDMTATKILCPTDFSAGSDQALRTAVRLANETDAELVIAHSWYVPPSAYAELAVPPDLFQLMHEDAERGLAQAVLDAQKYGATRVSSKLLSGAPWLVLTHELVDPAYSLAVIGTHGRTGMARVLLGSVAGMVVRHAPCSVLVVRPDSEPTPYEHVLCPIDFSPSSREAMFMAAQMARRGGQGVTLLHAVEMPVAFTGEPTIDFAANVNGRAYEELKKWGNDLRRSVDVRTDVHTASGRPGVEILHAVEADPSIDLVVMGSHGRTGIKRVLLGSVAEKVVRHARCPVLVTRSRD